MKPRTVKLSNDGLFTVKLVISRVEFFARDSALPVKASVEIEYTSRLVALDHKSTEEAVKRLARSRQWAPEDLAIAIARLIAETINSQAPTPQHARYRVKVTLSMQSTSDTAATVTVEAA